MGGAKIKGNMKWNRGSGRSVMCDELKDVSCGSGFDSVPIGPLPATSKNKQINK